MNETNRTRKTKTLDNARSASNSFNQICTIRIELRDSDPLIWRQVEVPTGVSKTWGSLLALGGLIGLADA